MAAIVRAAGGLVWRRTSSGQAEVCVIGRARYHDWALPKGKLLRGEHPLTGAVREVWEETGIPVWPQLPLPPVRYQVGGAAKLVDYWLMAATATPEFTPNAEVDELRWLPAATAMACLTYPHDALLVRQWERLPAITSAVLLVRHALAGERDRWPGADQARPLTPEGTTTARRLCRLLELFAPQQLLSASPDRCLQTLAPLALHTGLPVSVESAFDEGGAAPALVAARLRDAATAAASTVICTQGKVIGPALAHLSGDPSYAAQATGKGDGWLLPFAGSLPLKPTRLRVGPPSRRPDRR